jgi:UvrD/REP helicase N-terminal domain
MGKAVRVHHGDEFQDTNQLQLELIRKLARSHQNVCVVGDDDQSIYGWRGAQISNILEFEHHFNKPTIIKLEQNYRSTNAILGVANSITGRNVKRASSPVQCQLSAPVVICGTAKSVGSHFLPTNHLLLSPLCPVRLSGESFPSVNSYVQLRDPLNGICNLIRQSIGLGFYHERPSDHRFRL